MIPTRYPQAESLDGQAAISRTPECSTPESRTSQISLSGVTGLAAYEPSTIFGLIAPKKRLAVARRGLFSLGLMTRSA